MPAEKIDVHGPLQPDVANAGGVSTRTVIILGAATALLGIALWILVALRFRQ